jgi:hypothetical protein
MWLKYVVTVLFTGWVTRPSQTRNNRESFSVWLLPFDLSGMGGPASSYATAGEDPKQREKRKWRKTDEAEESNTWRRGKPANMARSDWEPVTGVTLENCYRQIIRIALFLPTHALQLCRIFTPLHMFRLFIRTIYQEDQSIYTDYTSIIIVGSSFICRGVKNRT